MTDFDRIKFVLFGRSPIESFNPTRGRGRAARAPRAPSVRMCCDTQMAFLAPIVLKEQRAAARGSNAARPISSHVLRCPNVSLEQGALSSAPRRAAQTPRAPSTRMYCDAWHLLYIPKTRVARGTHSGARLTSRAHLASHVLRCPRGSKGNLPRRAAQKPHAPSVRMCCDTQK